MKKIVVVLYLGFFIIVLMIINTYNNNRTNTYSQPPKEVEVLSVNENTGFGIDGDFYLKYCNGPMVYVFRDGEWVRIGKYILPSKGRYVLDGEYRGYGSCDNITCYKETNLEILTLEYKKIGEVSSADYETFLVGDIVLPAYKSEKIKGLFRVDIQGFSDITCTTEKLFSKEYTIE